MTTSVPTDDRLISFGKETAKIPERLLLAHARGRVLFITGAGTSIPSGLPSFEKLVELTYKEVDPPLHALLRTKGTGGLSTQQAAEKERFRNKDYDVVLGMLERRMDGSGAGATVRNTIDSVLQRVPNSKTGALQAPRPSKLHRSLIRLADRGIATTIATTNFDRLLQEARPKGTATPTTYALGGIPRPGLRKDFAGVLHIHGVLSGGAGKFSDVVVTDRDFGEFYLRRRVVPDFIYDAARLYHLVLVGYSANDAPMRYLLNAVAADGSRFSDLKERFAFVEMPIPHDPVVLEDWKGRGITPIPYSEADEHVELSKTLQRWAELSAINGSKSTFTATIRKLVRKSRASTSDEDRDLFDHLYRRSNQVERTQLLEIVSNSGADLGWLSAISEIDSKHDGEPA